MKKNLFILAVVGLMVCLIGSVANAGGPSGPAGKSNVGHLDFCQKNPASLSCFDGAVFPPCGPMNDQSESVPCIKGTGWGKMKYNLEGQVFDFEFEGHGLKSLDTETENRISYTLIYYPDNGTGSGLIYLGSDVADRHGNVHIKGSLFTGNLPASYDSNHPKYCPVQPPNPKDCPSDLYGAKIWLVLSSDVCIRGSYAPLLTGYYYENLKDYLFGTSLITFTTPPEFEVCGEE